METLEQKLVEVISEVLANHFQPKGTNVLSDAPQDVAQREINEQYSHLVVQTLDSVMEVVGNHGRYTDRTLENVKQFCTIFNGYKQKAAPDFSNKEDVYLRLKLIAEEFFELVDACGMIRHYGLRQYIADNIFPGLKFEMAKEEIKEANPIEVLDALVDLRYVLDGATFAFGLDNEFVKGFNIVHNNNMSKMLLSPEEADIHAKYYKDQQGVDVLIEERPYGNKIAYVLICKHDPKDRWSKGKVLKPFGFKPVNLKRLF